MRFKKIVLVIVLSICQSVVFALNASVARQGRSYRAEKVAPWEISTPEKEGMNSKILLKAFKKAKRLGFYYSLLVVRHNKIVAEAYYNGRDKYIMDPLYSVTKSVTSALVGIAVDRGFIRDVNEKLNTFFPELLKYDPDSLKKQITIRQLLTMHSGFDSEENLKKEISNRSNYLEAILTSKRRFTPGTKYLYSTHGTHLLSGILTRATKQIMYDFAVEVLFRPLCIEHAAWIHDPNDLTLGGAGLFLTPRDMARFGVLYLQNGKINDQQIVPSNWISESTKNHREYTTPWEEMSNVGYGYHWWTGKIGDYAVYFASGIGGQWILNIPDLNLVVVATMNAYTEKGYTQMETFITLLDRWIIPSVIVTQ